MVEQINISLAGRTAVITGATRGIGKSISEIFLIAGANLILTGTNQEEIDELNLNNENPLILWVKADFSTLGDIEKFSEQLKTYDSIDICVNNAGINIIKPNDVCSQTEYQQLININLTAPFQILQTLLPVMRNNGWGRIINIASIWSKISTPNRSMYSMSKAGLAGLTRSLAVEYGKSNILVNAISPGFTLTELTKHSLSVAEIKSLSEQIPLQRFANPIEIANAVLFLCSDLNTYITGQNIILDGGFSIV